MKEIIFNMSVGAFIFMLFKLYFSITDISESIDRLTDQVGELRRDVKRRKESDE